VIIETGAAYHRPAIHEDLQKSVKNTTMVCKLRMETPSELCKEKGVTAKFLGVGFDPGG